MNQILHHNKWIIHTYVCIIQKIARNCIFYILCPYYDWTTLLYKKFPNISLLDVESASILIILEFNLNI
ncbi:hypothetical protein CVS40_12749 [Lucilia cuprina]|nr:hypothetical protein CVS40_12749 [Lucilia cuprina]